MGDFKPSFPSTAHEENMVFLDGRATPDLESDTGSQNTDLPLLSPASQPWIKFKEPKIATKLVQSVESINWQKALLKTIVFFVPSFLQHYITRDHGRPSTLTPTAYLDGIRGLGALAVYFCHYSYQAFTIAESWGCGSNNYHFLKLPIVRLWYQGPAAVCVFFVISGYALSYRPLKAIRKRDGRDFAATMSSLVFRRGLRLYLPTAASTLLVVALLQSGAYELTRDFATNPLYHKNIMEFHSLPLPSMSVQLIDWAWTMFNMFHVFSWDTYGGQPRSYDVHLWTIPLEFRCSLYLFLVLVATARLKTSLRFLVVAMVTWVTYRKGRWHLCLFLCGMVIAEMDLIRNVHQVATVLPVEKPRSFRRHVPLKSVFWSLLSVLGLYLMSQPDGRGEVTPGWVYLSSLIPKWWFEENFRYWQSAGAVIFVLAVGRCQTWQRFFNSPPVQYLGKISYAIYLMHAPAMHAMGYHWERWAYSITGTQGYWFNAGFFLGASLCIPTVIWWADIFWRAVDIPAVRFAKWMESKCIAKDPEPCMDAVEPAEKGN